MGLDYSTHKRLRDTPSRNSNNAIASELSAFALNISDDCPTSDVLAMLAERPDLPHPIIELFSHSPLAGHNTAVLIYDNKHIAQAAINTIINCPAKSSTTMATSPPQHHLSLHQPH
jgi:hypothetical protein